MRISSCTFSLRSRRLAGQVVDDDGLADDAPHGHARVQGGVGVLEDDLHAAAHAADVAAPHLGEVLPLEDDVAGGGLVEHQHTAADGGLAAAALAHQAQGLAPADEEGDLVDGLDVGDLALKDDAGGYREVHLEVAHVQKDVVQATGAAGGDVLRSHGRLPQAGALDLAPAPTRGHSQQADWWTLDTTWSGGDSCWQRATAILAAGPEVAALGHVDEVWREAFDGLQPVLAHLVQAGHRLQQAEGVGVAGVAVQLAGGGRLHDLAGVHHVDPVGVAGHDPQVVGDDDDRRPQVAGQLGEQFQDLGLDGHVQGGGRLVGQEQLGVAGEGHGDHHPLAHAARELVGIVVDAGLGLGDAHHLHQLDGAAGGGGAVHLQVQLQALGDLAADGEDGVEGGHGLLEDHGDAVAADTADLFLVGLEQVLALEEDLAADDLPGWVGDQSQYGEGADGLAAAALPDQAHDLSRLDVVADAVDRLHHPVVGEEVGPQVLYLEQGSRHAPSSDSPVRMVGKGRLEPPRLPAHDPKSCSSANSDTSPGGPPGTRTPNPLIKSQLLFRLS